MRGMEKRGRCSGGRGVGHWAWRGGRLGRVGGSETWKRDGERRPRQELGLSVWQVTWKLHSPHSLRCRPLAHSPPPRSPPPYPQVISSIFICIFVVAHIKPTWFTLFPASGSVGLWLAFMWTAQGVYVTRNAMSYARHVGKSPTTYLGLFNGCFLGVYGMTQIGGNLISASILEKGPTPATLTFLFVLFLSMAIFATFLFMLIRRDDVVLEGDEDKEQGAVGKGMKGWDQTKAMFRLFATPTFLLMLPLIFFQGLVFGYVERESTA